MYNIISLCFCFMISQLFCNGKLFVRRQTRHKFTATHYDWREEEVVVLCSYVHHESITPRRSITSV